MPWSEVVLKREGRGAEAHPSRQGIRSPRDPGAALVRGSGADTPHSLRPEGAGRHRVSSRRLNRR